MLSILSGIAALAFAADHYLPVEESYELADGSRYEGEFRGGKANGKGVFTLADGTVYRGSWSNGKANGEFQVTLPDGSRTTQTWTDDKQVKP